MSVPNTLRFAGMVIVLYVFAPAAPGMAQCQVLQVDPQDVTAGDEFGRAASVSGDAAVFGAFKQECTAGSFCGAAYVFRRNGTGWSREQKLIPADLQASQYFGGATAISDDVILVGAAGDASASGAAYIFRWSGATWVEEAKIKPGDASAGDNFSISVSIEDDIAVGGAPLDNIDSVAWAGSATVFKLVGEAWNQVVKLTASDAEAGDQFGISVSVRGDRILVGAHRDDTACPSNPDCNSGSAYVFNWNGSMWVEEAKLIASDVAEGDGFAYSCELSGDRAIIGAPGADPTGAAYVFRREGTSWIEEAKLTPPAGEPAGYFGYVSMFGDLALVGDGSDDGACPGDPGCNSGAAYLFRRYDTVWVLVQKLTAEDAEAGDVFGWMKSVGVGQDFAAIGASRRDEVGEDSGAAYVVDLDCVPTIPTTSDWGLAAMALLVVSAATIVLLRRRGVTT